MAAGDRHHFVVVASLLGRAGRAAWRRWAIITGRPDRRLLARVYRPPPVRAEHSASGDDYPVYTATAVYGRYTAVYGWYTAGTISVAEYDK